MSRSRVTTVLLGLLATCVTVSPAWCQEGEKYAFLVGPQQYSQSSGLNRLRYAERDVEELAAELRRRGYRQENVVVLTMDRARGVDTRFIPSKANIVKELDLLLRHRQAGDTVVVALVGHGVMFKGDDDSYFCPIDANLSERKNLLSLEKEVFEKLKGCPASRKLVLYDACRDDPFSKDSRTPSTVTRPTVKRPPGGLAILYACSKDERSFENEDLGHGVFTHYVLESLRGSGDLDSDGKIGVFELAHHVPRRVADFVRSKYGTSQMPTLRGEVTDFPLVEMGKTLKTLITNTLGMKLKLIPKGEFLMGSPDSDEDADDHEHPQHRVRITKPFYLGVTEVTQGQWEAVMGTEPWKGQTYAKEGPDYAASCVSRDHVVAFCEKLSSKEGVTYRLPTEAEWEYACRAGTTTVYSFGDDASRLGDYAWFEDNAYDVDEKYAHRVGQKKANPFGLYDMHGNVYEWCQDWYGKDYYAGSPPDDPPGADGGSGRVLRGGSWGNSARFCRSAVRNWGSPVNRYGYLGFRVARSPSGR